MEGELRPGISLIPRETVLSPSGNKGVVLLDKADPRGRRGKGEKRDSSVHIFENPHIAIWYD